MSEPTNAPTNEPTNEETERPFDVVDKRASREAAAEAATQSESTAETDDEHEQAMGMPLFAVTDILRMAVGMLNEKAWVHLGMNPDPITNNVAADLPMARLAIDALGDLARHLEPHLDAADKRELQVMVSNLRINYMQKSK